MYKNIRSKVIVNVQLTEEIKVNRSIRQGCPLSMLLHVYAVAIEPLAIKMKQNKNIQDIKIPNYEDQIKLFQHADDYSSIITNLNSYDLLINEFKDFGIAPSSKINENKTEIL